MFELSPEVAKQVDSIVLTLRNVAVYSTETMRSHIGKLCRIVNWLKSGNNSLKVVLSLLIARFAVTLLSYLIDFYGVERGKERLSEIYVSLRSRLIAKVTQRYSDNAMFRQDWQASRQLAYVFQPEGHPHPQSAASRTGASRAMSEFIRLHGCEEYVVSLSTRDEGEEGLHELVQPKDILHAPVCYDILRHHVIKMVDVDYYVDMHKWLGYGRPILLYTFNPTEVAYSGPEYEYHVTGEGVEMQVRGGTSYNHKLWDYNTDYVLTRKGWFNWVVSSVDARKVDEHHMAICLVPIAEVPFWGWFLPLSVLKRRSFTKSDKVVATRFQANGVDTTSLKMLSKTTHVTLPTEYYEAALVRLCEAKKPVISDIERYLVKAKHPNPPVGAAILFEVILNCPNLISWWKTSEASAAKGPVDKSHQRVPNRYQSTVGLVTEDGKEIGRSLAPSIVTHPDVIPNRSYNNDLASITGRVRNQLNFVDPPQRYNKWVGEFITELIPNPHRGSPLDVEDVIEIQDRVTQRARSEKERPWMMADPAINLRSFMKGESYAKVSDPRNITTVGTEHTLRLSAFTYAFKKDVLLHRKWYAPGKTPREISNRIVEICGFDQVTEGDFSRFDGTISLWLRQQLEQAAYLRWVNHDDLPLLKTLLNNEIGEKAWTSEGLPYEPQHSRLSGSPLTTDANTIICAFVAYAAAREGGLSHQTAWDLLGIFGGDDSLSPIKGQYLERAAKNLGMKLKAVRRHAGDIVTFLGRVFPEAFNGGIGSVQDPMRTWRKLPYSFAPIYVSDEQALADKATGLLALDANAPVTSTWCRKVLELGNVEGHITDDCPWYARMAAVHGDSWPQCEWDSAIDAVARSTGYTAEEIRLFDDLIEAATSLEEIEGIIDNPNTEIVIPATLNGHIVEPDEDNESIATAVLPPRNGDVRRQPRAARAPVPRNNAARRPFPRVPNAPGQHPQQRGAAGRGRQGAHGIPVNPDVARLVRGPRLNQNWVRAQGAPRPRL